MKSERTDFSEFSIQSKQELRRNVFSNPDVKRRVAPLSVMENSIGFTKYEVLKLI